MSFKILILTWFQSCTVHRAGCLLPVCLALTHLIRIYANKATNRVNILYLVLLNKSHERRRERMGKTGKMVDRSMDAVRAVDEGKEDGTGQQGQAGENALKDLTDMENEDFVYVY